MRGVRRIPVRIPARNRDSATLDRAAREKISKLRFGGGPGKNRRRFSVDPNMLAM